MSDPSVTYRAHGQMMIGQADKRYPGQAPGFVETWYDVAGDDFGGSVRIRGMALAVEDRDDYQAFVIDGTTYVTGSNLGPPLEADTPASVRHPNPFLLLGPDDLKFVRVTAAGDFEYEVLPWVNGEPIGEWSDVGLNGDNPLASATVDSHETRLIVDEDGVPLRLASTWTLTAGGETHEASFVDEYDAFGLYVNVEAPQRDGFPPMWSHDVDGGGHIRADGPYIEVRPPAGPSAELRITFAHPEEPVLLGIEGALAFVRAHDPDDEVVLDRMISFDTGTVDVPIGMLTVVVYYRTCDGGCGSLDPPTDFCFVDLDAVDGAVYELEVVVKGRERAQCSLGV